MKSKIALFDMADWKNGLAFKNIHFSDKGLPVIKIAELKNGITSQTNFTEQTFDKSVSLKYGDMLFSWSGNPETSIDVFRYKLNNGWLNQHIFKVSPKPDINPDFLFYTLKNLKPLFTAIASNKQTTGLGHVTIKDLKEIEIVLPSMEKQLAISSFLKTIDDKIDVNIDINKNLLEQAKIFYDNWLNSFNGSQEELGNIIDVRDGTHDSPKPIANGYPLITSKHLKPFELDLTTPNMISKEDYDKANERSRVETNDILMSMIGTIGLISFVHYKSINFAIKNMALFKTSKNIIYAYYLFLFLNSNIAKDYFASCVAGSTQQYISLNMLRKMPIKKVAVESLSKLNCFVKPIIDEICANTIENSKLYSLRDTILPKLMSGELDVSEIDI